MKATAKSVRSVRIIFLQVVLMFLLVNFNNCSGGFESGELSSGLGGLDTSFQDPGIGGDGNDPDGGIDPNDGDLPLLPEGAISVEEFGARPSDNVDDTLALREALAQMPVGGILYFPPGLYEISEPVLIDKSMELVGAGESSELRYVGSRDFYQEAAEALGKSKVRVGLLNLYADDISLRDLAVNQNFSASGRVDGDRPLIGSVLLGGFHTGAPKVIENINIEGVHFLDFYGDALSGYKVGVRRVRVNTCTFTSSYVVQSWSEAGVAGEQAISFTQVEGAEITNNIILGALDDAIAIHRNSSNVLIADNHITTTGGRIFMGGTDGGVIRNNYLKYIEPGAFGIFLSFEEQARVASLNRNILIEGNTILSEDTTIKMFTNGILLSGGGDQIVIRDNKIQSGVQANNGIRLVARKHEDLDGAVTWYGNSNVEISNNEIVNFIRGISVDFRNLEASGDRTVTIGENRFINVETSEYFFD